MPEIGLVAGIALGATLCARRAQNHAKATRPDAMRHSTTIKSNRGNVRHASVLLAAVGAVLGYLLAEPLSAAMTEILVEKVRGDLQQDVSIVAIGSATYGVAVLTLTGGCGYFGWSIGPRIGGRDGKDDHA